MANPRLISSCVTGWRRGSRGRSFTSWSSWAANSRSAGRRSLGSGAAGPSSGSAIRARIANEDGQAPQGKGSRDGSLMDERTAGSQPLGREWVTTRFAQLGQPGRRGFGGAADAAEAAALRQATRGDHDLNPGMTPPSVELRPAAVLVPLVDRAGGMSVLLTRRTAH